MTDEQLEQIREMIAEPSPEMVGAALDAISFGEGLCDRIDQETALNFIRAALYAMAEPMHTAIFGDPQQ